MKSSSSTAEVGSEEKPRVRGNLLREDPDPLRAPLGCSKELFLPLFLNLFPRNYTPSWSSDETAVLNKRGTQSATPAHLIKKLLPSSQRGVADSSNLDLHQLRLGDLAIALVNEQIFDQTIRPFCRPFSSSFDSERPAKQKCPSMSLGACSMLGTAV